MSLTNLKVRKVNIELIPVNDVENNPVQIEMIHTFPKKLLC